MVMVKRVEHLYLALVSPLIFATILMEEIQQIQAQIKDKGASETAISTRNVQLQVQMTTNTR
jgi:citrate lyase gamma subunit